MRNSDIYSTSKDKKQKVMTDMKSIMLNPKPYGLRSGGVRKNNKKNIAKSKRA
jgi:hypothetical protein